MIKEFIKRIIILNIIFSLMMMMYRMIFTFYYFESLFYKSLYCLMHAFIFGFRYDIAILSYINFIVIFFVAIFWFIGNQKLFVKFVKTLKYYYAIFFGFIVFLFCVDFGFFSYFFVHINYLFFELFNNQISYLWYISKKEHLLFFVLLLILIICLLFIFYISKYVLEKNIEKYTLCNKIHKKIITVGLIIIINLSFLLNIMWVNKDNMVALFSQYYFACQNVIISNFFFNAIDLVIRNRKMRSEYNKNIGKAFADFLDRNEVEISKEKPELSLQKNVKYNEKNSPNIILIIVESLGMDLLQYNNENFNIMGELKKHFDEDIVFYNCLFSYEQTMSSLEIIGTSFFRYPTYRAKFSQFPNKIKNIDNDYEFYYVTDNGNKSVNDEDILKNIFEILENNENKKNFIVALTTTSHTPFNLPTDYKDTIKIPINMSSFFMHPEGVRAFQYSCQKLGEFLTKIKKSKYANNTVVAITGDHYSRITHTAIDTYEYTFIRNNNHNLITENSVPFYLYIPKNLKPNEEQIDTSKVISHVDIMPTLYELFLSDITYYSIGTNVFDKNYQSAIALKNNKAIIVNDNDVCVYDISSDKIYSYEIIRKQNELTKYKKNITITEKHKKMIKKYKAAMEISQYILEKGIK